jgi:hypothetical protein
MSESKFRSKIKIRIGIRRRNRNRNQNFDKIRMKIGRNFDFVESKQSTSKPKLKLRFRHRNRNKEISTKFRRNFGIVEMIFVETLIGPSISCHRRHLCCYLLQGSVGVLLTFSLGSVLNWWQISLTLLALVLPITLSLW